MRVFHVISSPALTCGAAQQISAPSAGISRAGTTAQLCVLRTRNDDRLQSERCAGLTTVVLELRGMFGAFTARKLRREIETFRPDLIHVWDEAALVLVRLAGLKKMPRLVMQLSADDPKSLLGALTAKRMRPAVQRFVAATADAKRKAVARGCEPAKVVAIPVGVDAVPPPAASREEFLREFALPENAHCVAVVGRLLLRKRHKDMIWAADMLKFYGLEMHVLVFGDGPQRWRLERYARQCYVDDRVHFLGERADVRRWLPQCDLLWQAEEPAGSGAAILEAMAAGIPVVASDIPAHREFIASGATGLLVPVGARAEFAIAANRLIGDRELAQRLGAAGRERVRTDFTTEKMVERFESLYRVVLDRRG